MFVLSDDYTWHACPGDDLPAMTKMNLAPVVGKMMTKSPRIVVAVVVVFVAAAVAVNVAVVAIAAVIVSTSSSL